MKLKSTIGSKYQLVRNSDGTFNVLQVPIFKLGNSKGFDYTSQWFEKLKLNHKRMERETGYKPTFFIGHNSYNRGEAPALGYIQNLTLDGNTVKADLCNFKENTFDIFKKYPYRSVEVFYNKDKGYYFGGLALLGSRPPYHKLGVLFDDENPNKQAFVYADGEKEDVFSTIQDFDFNNSKTSKNSTLSKLKNAFLSFFTQLETNQDFGNNTSPTDVSPKQNTFNNNAQQENTMEFTAQQRQAFKQEFGYYPEEGKQAIEEAIKAKENAQKQQFASEIKSFKANLKAKHFAPAIIEKAEDFFNQHGQNPKIADSFKQFMEAIALAVENKSLTYNEGEVTAEGTKPTAKLKTTNQKYSDEQDKAADKAILKIMNTQKCSYSEAFDIYVNSRG